MLYEPSLLLCMREESRGFAVCSAVSVLFGVWSFGG